MHVCRARVRATAGGSIETIDPEILDTCVHVRVRVRVRARMCVYRTDV